MVWPTEHETSELVSVSFFKMMMYSKRFVALPINFKCDNFIIFLVHLGEVQCCSRTGEG